MKYDKLVRDLIPKLLEQKGLKFHIHTAASDEYSLRLGAKLEEEVGEYLASESVEEIADILEVIEAICEQKGFSQEEVQKIKQAKRVERGAFAERIILEDTFE